MTEADNSEPRHTTGIMPSHVLRELIRAREILAVPDIADDQIQPASLDLRLGAVAYRVRSSFLPGPERTVEQCVAQFSLHEIDLRQGAVLETGCVYVVPLLEHLNLGHALSGVANPKSSTGRIDVFTRLIADRAGEFDRVAAGYRGPLYAEISPLTFGIVVRQGARLNQMRLRRGSPPPNDARLRALHERVNLVGDAADKKNIRKGALDFTVDLAGDPDSGLVGYRAKRHTGLIDVDRIAAYEPLDYWDPIYANERRQLILDPNDFYILVSKETVKVPPDYAAEMVAYDTQVGEFRVHYAGFFDPGFGYSEDGSAGSRAVLEVRSHKVPFILEDGQTVGRLVYERLTDPPQELYGQTGSSYQGQGLALSKHFKRV
ncbi:MAG: 2'-deoxycytidine 5'-triphosphate deaminase [Alphaproteobacteria bacterium]|nr:2'-deoxycytidine 5'-triphosphate deaminase [Alphaproteobacteria bacterium]